MGSYIVVYGEIVSYLECFCNLNVDLLRSYQNNRKNTKIYKLKYVYDSKIYSNPISISKATPYARRISRKSESVFNLISDSRDSVFSSMRGGRLKYKMR